MMNGVPLIGSVSQGFGSNMMATTPTEKTPNIEEASKDFVSMLYSYMFQQMRESASDEEDGLFSGPHVNMLMGFMDQEIGKKLSHSEGKGLADALLRQLNGGKPDATEAQKVEEIEAAGNTLRELTADEVMPIEGNDNALNQQMMDEFYKLNQR